MLYLVIALCVLGVLSAVLGLLGSRGKSDEAPLQEGVSCNTCNGSNSRCEQECMMEAATKAPEYFDDEELDRYRGKPSDSYSPDEVEEFADVLYTMHPEEVAAWNRSLLLRGINLPDALKDEVIAFIDETNNNA